MTIPPPFLKDRLEVRSLDGDLVAVTVTLPAELVKDYCRFLEAFSNFFQVVSLPY